ncbi:MAG: hypothetical protein JWM07_262 [Candidatus Saccharibacteria bacterium]|jgi:phosphatidylglycerophosphate synthase|nr:hypothetical protein [Candidatus Saccharibacteria bacterium]
MNLHRSNNKPDWSGIRPDEYNYWQMVAVKTNGILTPGNIATMVGLGLVMIGLYMIINQQYWVGMVLIIVGRLFDLVDGWLADVTQTKSPLGELLDAAIDKVETFFTIIVFYVASIALWWLLTVLLLPHIWITYIAWTARCKNKQLHPSRIGKISMAALWVALFGFIVLRALNTSSVDILAVMIYIVSAISVGLGIYTAIGYITNKN